MPTLVTCRCGQSFHAPDHVAGQTLPCPVCGQGLLIPAALGPLAGMPTMLPSRSDHGGGGRSTPQELNWGLIAALAGGGAALVLLLLVVVLVAWNSLPGGQRISASPPAPFGEKLQADPVVPNASRSVAVGPQIQVGPLGAAPDPPQPRPLPTSEPPNLPPGQTITLADGRFTVWVPTQQPLVEKMEGSGEDLFRYYDLAAPNGASLRVMAAFGSNGEHTRSGIEMARELSAKPRSILEEPWVVIEHQGVAGTVTEKQQQRYTKASRRREFYYDEVGFVFWASGTDEQVNAPEIDWFFASLKFGKPEE